MLNSRDIDTLRSDVAANCRVWLELCKEAGLAVLVTGTVRDEEYQRWCYEQGTAATPVPSFHGEKAGLAFDFCQNIKGREYSDLAFFQKAGELGELVGFEWGGRWSSFPDRPHLQWSDGGKYTSAMIRAGNYPPDMPLYQLHSEEDKMQIYHWFKDMPDWARPSAEKAYNKGVIKADAQTGAVNVYETNLQAIVWLDRLGLLE
ncbi:M15 family metallopeptidase [Flavonifractor hominis]|uniref:M15 family metallopeptidase n=1 Tax=Flavonifractor hominis TaxID=3133178 RepID=A0ABV1EK67_9FIRM